MPSDPVIVPPTPVINQGDSPEEIQRVGENVQKIFDKVAPKFGGTEKPGEPSPEPQPKQPDTAPSAPVEPAKEPPKEPPQTEPKVAKGDHAIPSFIDSLIKGETPPAPPAEEDFPEELPAFKSSDEAKQRYKNWREKWQALKNENKSLRERPALDDATRERMTFLENKTKEQDAQLSVMSVNMHPDFQNNIIRPMHMAWNEAARIVTEAGGSQEELAKAMQKSGREQYEALDEVFERLPESARAEAHTALAAFRRADEQRKAALAEAPKTVEALKKRDLERQMAYVERQRKDMGAMFDEAVRVLRDEAKVEVFQKSSDPDAKWWNDQGDQAIAVSRDLFLDNRDLKRMAFAVAMAPLADIYRKLWVAERSARMKSDGIIRDRLGAEPALSESGGNFPVPGDSNVQEDLKKPFSEVFLREFHRARASGLR